MFFCLQSVCLLYIYFAKRWGGIWSRGGKAIRANHCFFAFVSFSWSRRMRREASSVGRPRFRGPGPPWGDLTSWENSLRLNLYLSLFTFLLPLLHSRPSWKEVEKKEKTTLVTRWQRKRWTLISLTPRWFCIFHRSLIDLWTLLHSEPASESHQDFLIYWTPWSTESQKPRQRVSNADRKVFATSSLLAEEFPDTLQYKISR